MHYFLIWIKTRVNIHSHTALFLHKTANEIILKQETIFIILFKILKKVPAANPDNMRSIS